MGIDGDGHIVKTEVPVVDDEAVQGVLGVVFREDMGD